MCHFETSYAASHMDTGRKFLTGCGHFFPLQENCLKKIQFSCLDAKKELRLQYALFSIARCEGNTLNSVSVWLIATEIRLQFERKWVSIDGNR